MSAPILPTIHAAGVATDGSDAVDRGAELIRPAAETRRRAGEDIVVCGPDPFANDRLAHNIEQAVTPPGSRCLHHGPHLGSQSLPHWQHKPPRDSGHSFYETPVRKARVP